MKIYVAHSSDFEFKNELYLPLRNSELNKIHEIFLPHEKEEFEHTKERIKNSDVLVAEVSYPSIGEGIELGWADDAGVKIICMYKKGSKISSSLKLVSDTFVTYLTKEDMIEKLSVVLKVPNSN